MKSRNIIPSEHEMCTFPWIQPGTKDAQYNVLGLETKKKKGKGKKKRERPDDLGLGEFLSEESSVKSDNYEFDPEEADSMDYDINEAEDAL